MKLLHVQHRATKLVQDIENWSYEETLEFLGLTRLDKRRDLIETFKIMNGILDVDRD